jgi:putative spermidine/putrescine transport system permease protein
MSWLRNGARWSPTPESPVTDAVISVEGRTTGAALSASPTAPSRAPRNWAWVGLLPFIAFLTLFLIIPTISVFQESLKDSSGNFSFSSMGDAFKGQNRDAFFFSIKFSAGAAAVGVVLGALLAYAAATAVRPRWLRNLVTSFSGVAANLGGIPLAFAFLALLGRQGVLTKIITEVIGYDLYGHGFQFKTVPGLITVYSYFNIPLMLLITLPAIDGLKTSWREANANLGGTNLTYWRRVGLPVLAPSLLGGFLLLFANSFSAYATAAALTDSSRIVSLRLAFFLGGDVNAGEDAVGFSLAAWMILIMALAMGLYWVLRKRAERWQES